MADRDQPSTPMAWANLHPPTSAAAAEQGQNTHPQTVGAPRTQEVVPFQRGAATVMDSPVFIQLTAMQFQHLIESLTTSAFAHGRTSGRSEFNVTSSAAAADTAQSGTTIVEISGDPPVDTPPVETPPVETPPVETPTVTTPTVTPPPVETPPVTPPVETPPVTPPPVETPPVETPPVETPPVETPPVETPVETPPVETQPGAAGAATQADPFIISADDFEDMRLICNPSPTPIDYFWRSPTPSPEREAPPQHLHRRGTTDPCDLDDFFPSSQKRGATSDKGSLLQFERYNSPVSSTSRDRSESPTNERFSSRRRPSLSLKAGRSTSPGPFATSMSRDRRVSPTRGRFSSGAQASSLSFLKAGRSSSPGHSSTSTSRDRRVSPTRGRFSSGAQASSLSFLKAGRSSSPGHSSTSTSRDRGLSPTNGRFSSGAQASSLSFLKAGRSSSPRHSSTSTSWDRGLSPTNGRFSSGAQALSQSPKTGRSRSPGHSSTSRDRGLSPTNGRFSSGAQALSQSPKTGRSRSPGHSSTSRDRGLSPTNGRFSSGALALSQSPKAGRSSSPNHSSMSWDRPGKFPSSLSFKAERSPSPGPSTSRGSEDDFRRATGRSKFGRPYNTYNRKCTSPWNECCASQSRQSQSPPKSSEALAKRPDTKVTKKRGRPKGSKNKQPSEKKGKNDNKFICRICLEDGELVSTTCGHTFHDVCLLNWLVASNQVHKTFKKCPYCGQLYENQFKLFG